MQLLLKQGGFLIGRKAAIGSGWVGAATGACDRDGGNNKLAQRSQSEQKLLTTRWAQGTPKPVRNITSGQWDLIQFLRRNDLYIVVEGDKNLGPCILDQITYIKRGCLEHIGNSTNYKELDERWAKLTMKKLDYQFKGWLTKYTRLKKSQKQKLLSLGERESKTQTNSPDFE